MTPSRVVLIEDHTPSLCLKMQFVSDFSKCTWDLSFFHIQTPVNIKLGGKDFRAR